MTRSAPLPYVMILMTATSLAHAAEPVFTTKAELGKALFFDVNLSVNRNQSCATCHNPSTGFADPRDNGVKGAASLGSDNTSVGDRNAPTAAYALFSPAFELKDGKYQGGQFHDGRVNTLAEQAMGPPTNPVEMAMPDNTAILQRLLENASYRESFNKLYGPEVLNDAEQAYLAMADSIATFESTDFFAPFDSKYDRYLKGEYQLTDAEELGRTLFFSQQFTNCNQCHQLKTRPGMNQETFTNYQYFNIGTPVNNDLRAVNGVSPEHKDRGLLDNPAVEDPAQAGKFKVPTLRNVAVTGPYMHNGVFQDLRTVILFYNKYNSRSAKRQINPETGKQWQSPEIPENIALKELESGPALDNKRIDALVAFMNTLTDQRYEHLPTKN
ncbi:cytochrome-c peroxidase [Aliamphritea ceti]|uniref:cytochrome-c peroxidase n=1 Tax=Aliamphritea ceti TaxID=1524258 RepID=UPI003014F5BA